MRQTQRIHVVGTTYPYMEQTDTMFPQTQRMDTYSECMKQTWSTTDTVYQCVQWPQWADTQD